MRKVVVIRQYKLNLYYKMNIQSFNNSTNIMEVCRQEQQSNPVIEYRQNQADKSIIDNNCEDDDANNISSIDMSMFCDEDISSSHHSTDSNKMVNNSKSIQANQFNFDNYLPNHNNNNIMEYLINSTQMDQMNASINTSGGYVISYVDERQTHQLNFYQNSNYSHSHSQTLNFTQQHHENFQEKKKNYFHSNYKNNYEHNNNNNNYNYNYNNNNNNNKPYYRFNYNNNYRCQENNDQNSFYKGYAENRNQNFADKRHQFRRKQINFDRNKYNHKNNYDKKQSHSRSKKRQSFYQDYDCHQNPHYKSRNIKSWFIRVGTPSSSSCEEEKHSPKVLKYKQKEVLPSVSLPTQVYTQQIKQPTNKSPINQSPMSIKVQVGVEVEVEVKKVSQHRQEQYTQNNKVLRQISIDSIQDDKLLKEISIDQIQEDNLLLTSQKAPETANKLEELVKEQITQIGQYIQLPKCSYQQYHYGQNSWKQNQNQQQEFDQNRKKKKRVYDVNNSVNQQIKKQFFKEIHGKQFNQAKQSKKTLNLKYPTLSQLNLEKQVTDNNNKVQVQPALPVKETISTQLDKTIDYQTNNTSKAKIKKEEDQAKAKQKQIINNSVQKSIDEQSFSKYEFPTKNICYAFKKSKMEIMPQQQKTKDRRDMLLFYSSPIKYEPKIKKIQKYSIKLKIKAQAIENIIIHSFKYKNIKIKTKNKEIQLNTSELKVLELDRKYSIPRNYNKNTLIEWNLCSLQALNKDSRSNNNVIILAVSVKCKFCHKNCDGEVDGSNFTKICQCAQIVQFEILNIEDKLIQ